SHHRPGRTKGRSTDADGDEDVAEELLLNKICTNRLDNGSFIDAMLSRVPENDPDQSVNIAKACLDQPWTSRRRLLGNPNLSTGAGLLRRVETCFREDLQD
ncbi:MAG TPA: hypothetical protein VK395_36440, partial [Gemmataceae bacterium]|nr:hypothetical protein [Gemmataceae bacterium]